MDAFNKRCLSDISVRINQTHAADEGPLGVGGELGNGPIEIESFFGFVDGTGAVLVRAIDPGVVFLVEVVEARSLVGRG